MDGGYTRLGFTLEEQEAIRAFKQIAQELQLTISEDEIGNVIATFHGMDPSLPSIAFGSHLDTVTNGGAYDGVVGVLAGLGVIKQLKDFNYKPHRSINVICFISEESSRFGVSTIGSKAMAGLLDVERIKRLTDQNQITFQEAIEQLGFDIEKIKLMGKKRNQFHSFVEIHIEQGNILKDSNKKIGIVQTIATPLRYKISFEGEASHTGTTPMGKRKDTLATAARFISFIEDLGNTYANKDHFVATVSVAHVSPNVMNVIPEKTELYLDIRSINEELLEKAEVMINSYCTFLMKKYELNIRLYQISKELPIHLDNTVTSHLVEATNLANCSYQYMVSGAGHDVMNMAQIWPSGLIFIPCEGISHHPDEYTDPNNILNGINVLINYIKLVEKKENSNG
mgnify:CR=1 FL=1